MSDEKQISSICDMAEDLFVSLIPQLISNLKFEALKLST